MGPGTALGGHGCEEETFCRSCLDAEGMPWGVGYAIDCLAGCLFGCGRVDARWFREER
jgi:hypothetical protein